MQPRKSADLVDALVQPAPRQHDRSLHGREAVLLGGVEHGEGRVVDPPDIGERLIVVVGLTGALRGRA